MVVRDVKTRWNYTHAMIRRGDNTRAVIDTWVFNTEELRSATLSSADWKLLGQIADVLE
ncbi:hypothetical protein BDZ97DRAFT_1638946, partial [Flammula alnicola]